MSYSSAAMFPKPALAGTATIKDMLSRTQKPLLFKSGFAYAGGRQSGLPRSNISMSGGLCKGPEMWQVMASLVVANVGCWPTTSTSPLVFAQGGIHTGALGGNDPAVFHETEFVEADCHGGR